MLPQDQNNKTKGVCQVYFHVSNRINSAVIRLQPRLKSRTRSTRCSRFFCGRVWLDPSDTDSRRKLQQAYSDLCATFPAFARSVSCEAFLHRPSPAPETAGTAAARGERGAVSSLPPHRLRFLVPSHRLPHLSDHPIGSCVSHLFPQSRSPWHTLPPVDNLRYHRGVSLPVTSTRHARRPPPPEPLPWRRQLLTPPCEQSAQIRSPRAVGDW
jgi:hypothetical protein